MSKIKKEKISVSIDIEVNDKLTTVCETDFINKSKLVNSLIKEWLEKNKNVKWEA